MKKRSLLSLLLALVLCFSMFVTGAAKASVAGDVDGDGKVTASDARKALRASVNLDKLTTEEEKVADVDGKSGVTAADARLILRASVGLETLKTKEKTFNGHIVNNDSIGIETGIVCIDPDCCGETLVPSFNDLVNSLKAQGSLNRQYGFSKSVVTTEKAKATESSFLYWALAQTLQSMLNKDIKEGTETEYSEFTRNRHINSSNFYVYGESYVSALKDSDIKSITMTKMSGVDFVKNLPDSYKATASGQTIDLKSIKNSSIGDVYKVSVVLNPETITSAGIPKESTPIEKILRADYNKGLAENFESLDNMFKESPEMANFMGMEMAIITNCTVNYYFTADKFQPVCAQYSVVMRTENKTNIYVNDDGEKQKTPTVSIAINATTTQDNYYFFNDHFTIK